MLKCFFAVAVVCLVVISCKFSSPPNGNHQIVLENTSQNLTKILAEADTFAFSADSTKFNPQKAIQTYKTTLPLLRMYDDSLGRWLRVNRLVARIYGGDLHKKDSSLVHVSFALSELAKWREAKSVFEHIELFRLYFLEAFMAKDEGDLVRSRSALERAEKIFKGPIWGKDHPMAPFFYLQIANLHVRMGEYENAINYFKEAISYEQTFDQDNVVNYNDYGNVFLSIEDYGEALKLFDEGLEKPMNSYYTRTYLYLNKAEALLNLGDIASAERYNAVASVRMEKDQKFTEEELAKCKIGYLENQGLVAEKNKLWTCARDAYGKIIDTILLPHLGRRDLAGYLASIANTYLQERNPTTALEYYHKAYLKYYPNSGADIAALPNVGEMPGDRILIKILEGKAQCLAVLEQYDQALLAYERIPEIESQLRATHAFEKSMLRALKDSRSRFDQAADLAWTAWEKSKQAKYAAIAFQFTERARGALQTKGINHNEALDLLSEDQKVIDKHLKDEIVIAETQLAETEEDDKLQILMAQVRTLKQQQQKTRTEWAKSNPAYAAAIGENKVTAASEVSKLLRKGQTLLDYYFTPSNQLYVFAFDAAGNAAWTRRSWSPDAQMAVDTLLQLISRNPAEGDAPLFAKQALLLGQQLLAAPDAVFLGKNAPILDTCLLVVPDLKLAALPFDLLLTQPATGGDWAAMPYALKQYRIGYGYSASLLGMQQAITQKRSGKARVPFVGFAPEYHDGTPPLEKADDDVRFGAQLFGGQPLLGTDASEAKYREMAEQAQILLLSMHGISNHEEPGLSCLRMGDTLRDGTYDNILHANELQAIPCRADLAVMSACFTGDGPVKVGEGVYSMARSFAIAGVPATTMSLWRFPVKSSSVLVCDFLTGIHQKMSKDVALHRAKVNWLAQNQGSKFAHPYFWAGMVAAGDMSPMRTGSNVWGYMAAALGVLLLAGAWWRFRVVRGKQVAA